MIRAERSHLTVVARSHPGMTGKNNEDRYAVSAFQVSDNDPTPSVLAVLSDGIGGHRAGEVAAEMAVELISQRIAESDAQAPSATLNSAIVEASQRIYAQAQGNPDLEGMGGTCACVWVIGNRLYSGSVGDSRIYILRGNAIRQITTDHTWIQEALDHGIIKRDEIRGHPNAHVIRRFLGSPTPPQVDQRLRLSKDENDEQAEANQGLRLHQGDRLLLCSDGLTDLVKDDEIVSTLNSSASLEEGVEKLVKLSCDRGGFDNITIVALEEPVQAKPVLAPAPRRKSAAKNLPLGCAGLALIALLVGFALWSLGIISIPDLNGLPGILAPSTPSETALPAGQTPLPGLFSTPSATTTPTLELTAPTQSNPTLPGPTYTPWPTNTRITPP